jgi:ribosomal protein S12 methylthiotransferase
MRLQQKISLAHNKSFVSKTFKTLIERFDPQANIYIGRTTRLSPEIDGEVIIKSAKKLQLNSFQKIKITKTSEYDLYGIEN